MKILLDLASHYSKGLVHTEEIASRQDIPKKFLEQILVELKRGGFVISKKGPKGGYVLATPPSNVSLGQVLRFVEGSLYPIACADCTQKNSCGDIERCVFLPIWKQVGDMTTKYLDGIDFRMLADDAQRITEERVSNYVI